ncbi:hypothetical protein, partial [Roseinatronobacter alkalisoli]
CNPRLHTFKRGAPIRNHSSPIRYGHRNSSPIAQAGLNQISILHATVVLENSGFLQSDFDHFWKVESPTRVQKLSFTTKDFSSDSGLTFTFENGHEVVIVAAAYPFYLSILGLSHGIETTPEFDISSYVKEDIFSISGQ